MNYKLEKFWKDIMIKSSPEAVAWTINLKSFENLPKMEQFYKTNLWTINLKSFEKEAYQYIKSREFRMNYKLEKFWKMNIRLNALVAADMNYKLEKFWK